MPNYEKYFERQRNHKQKVNGLYAAEIDFTIKIDNAEFEFWKYRDILYNATFDKLEFHKYNDNIKYERSPFEFFIRNRLKLITKDERVFLVITDYSEREGSFIVSFSFLAFMTFMNYGQFRESLNYLRDDLDYFLHGIYPHETKVLVDFHDRQNRIIEDINESIFRQTIDIVDRELKRLKLVVFIIGILALGFSVYSVFKIETQPIKQTFDKSTIQAVIRAELDKINSEKVNEELLRLLQQKNTDTIQQK